MLMCTTGEIHVLIGTKRIEVASQQFLLNAIQLKYFMCKSYYT